MHTNEASNGTHAPIARVMPMISGLQFIVSAVTGHSVGRKKRRAVPSSQATEAHPRGMDHLPRWKSQLWVFWPWDLCGWLASTVSVDGHVLCT